MNLMRTVHFIYFVSLNIFPADDLYAAKLRN